MKEDLEHATLDSQEDKRNKHDFFLLLFVNRGARTVFVQLGMEKVTLSIEMESGCGEKLEPL